MSSATLNIKVTPRRMLTSREAAEYCGLTARQFDAQCDVRPVELTDSILRYDMRDLDAWIDGKKSGHANDDEAILGRLEA